VTYRSLESPAFEEHVLAQLSFARYESKKV
jgi:hypothetical protein